MSTAFMVDNILQDKDPDHINDLFTSASDSESEPTSDHKDSLCCDSPPPSYEDHHHHLHHSQDTDELLQSYTVLRGARGNVIDGRGPVVDEDEDDDDHPRNNNEEAILMDNSNDDAICLDADTDSGGTKLCCGKCGHFQFGNKTIIDNEIQYEFKCDKCGSCDYIKVVHNSGSIISNSNPLMGNGKTTTMLNMENNLLKDNVVVSSKPVLKFSVSAILGERKDCVKVRNGKFTPFFVTNLKRRMLLAYHEIKKVKISPNGLKSGIVYTFLTLCYDFLNFRRPNNRRLYYYLITF